MRINRAKLKTGLYNFLISGSKYVSKSIQKIRYIKRNLHQFDFNFNVYILSFY